MNAEWIMGVQAMKKSRIPVFVLLLCVCLAACSFALAEYTVEEDGSKWYSDGRIEWADGTVTQSVNHDAGQTYDDGSSDSGSGTVTNADGSMTIVTADEDPFAGVTQNEDGSIEVVSGTGGVDIQNQPTAAPLEGEAWQAALDGVAAQNGKNTPMVWTDPATGETVSVNAVYMGIGRSMIAVNGEKKLVNTVDLKWQTEMPEDKVLAVVTSRQIWMHKSPSDSQKVLKFKKIYRGTVLRVISGGKNWTFVDYDGDRGYVKTGTLEFYANDHTEIEAGYLSLNGKIRGNGRVQVRDLDDNSDILDGFKPGTPVTVFDFIEEFAEIDVQGLHCVVNVSCLTMERELASAE